MHCCRADFPLRAACRSRFNSLHLQVNPLGRVVVPWGAEWRIESVTIAMLSFDWFLLAEASRQDNGGPGIRVDVWNSVLQSFQCSSDVRRDMAAAWAVAIGGNVNPSLDVRKSFLPCGIRTIN
jgi:hypothetical protein